MLTKEKKNIRQAQIRKHFPTHPQNYNKPPPCNKVKRDMLRNNSEIDNTFKKISLSNHRF